MASVSINPGPLKRADAILWRVPGKSALLVVERRLSGCAIAIALPLLALAAWLERSILTSEPSVGLVLLGMVPGAAGALLLFARHRLVLDRERRSAVSRITFFSRELKRGVRSLDAVKAVRIDEVYTEASSDEGSPTTTFTAKIELEGEEPIELASAGIWESVVPVAEGVAAFLELPLHDDVVDSRREPDELDASILEREKTERTRAPEPPPDSRTVVTHEGGVTRLTFPPPESRSVLGIAILVGIVWTLPVYLSGDLFWSLLPQAFLAWAWFQMRFGLRSSVEIERSMLRIVRHGVLVDRTREFQAGELEDLAVRDPEWGGSRNVIAHMTEGYLVARSDVANARFGWGLSKRELEWLRSYILTALEPSRERPRRSDPVGDIPIGAPSVVAPVAGLVAGALIARVLGGGLEICLAVPFLEHVVNVGGLIGLVVGAYIGGRRNPMMRPVVWVSVILLAAGIFYRDHPMLQPFPTYDEAMVAELRSPPVRFHVGWTVTAVLPNAIIAAIVLRLIGFFGHRRDRQAPPKRKPKVTRPPDPEREARNERVILFVAGVPFFLAGLFVLFGVRSGDDRVMQVIAGLLFTLAGLGLMQVWRLVPRHYWPTGIDWGAMLGVVAACGAGLSIIAVSIFASDEGMNAPRPVIGAAGATFLFAGIAILPSAVPRLAGEGEWITRVAACLLLTGFTVVSLWAVIDGAYVFVLAALLTGGLAIGSWVSLVKEILRRTK